MNLRLATNEVRVRLERAEAERLAGGEEIRQMLPLPGGHFSWAVVSTEAETGAALHGRELRISLSREKLQALMSEPASKDSGLRAEIAGDRALISLIVEIDLFDGKKRR